MKIRRGSDITFTINFEAFWNFVFGIGENQFTKSNIYNINLCYLFSVCHFYFLKMFLVYELPQSSEHVLYFLNCRKIILPLNSLVLSLERIFQVAKECVPRPWNDRFVANEFHGTSYATSKLWHKGTRPFRCFSGKAVFFPVESTPMEHLHCSI